MSSHLRSRLRSPHFMRAVAGVLVVVSAVCSPPTAARADDAANKPLVKSSANEDLARRQERIASKYAQLEELMLRMAQMEAAQNPRRAALLNQALGKSKDSHTKLQLETIATLLGKRQLSRAVKEQVDAGKSLEELLKLLQSEDRSERLKTEQERIKEYIKEVERMIRIQRSIQGQNEGGGDAKRIADEQNKLAQRAEDLADKIKENEEGSSESSKGQSPDDTKSPDDKGKPDAEKPAEKNEGDSKPSESPSGDELKPGEQPSEKKEPGAEQKPGEGEKPANKPGEGSESQPHENKPSESQPKESKPGESQPGESRPLESKPGSEKPSEGKPSEGKPSEGKPSEGKPSEGKPSEGNMPPQSGDMQPGEQGEQSPAGEQSQQQENPVRKKIQEAQQRMKAAEQKLQEAKRKESVEEQQKAREELEKAKAELEKILKQLREEEMERTLQALEGRFRKMLEMQVKVYEGTKKLDAIPAEDRTRELDVQAGRLGGDEAKIAMEAEKALQLLEEEGSSVAFPATVDLLVDDMRQTADRLNQGKVDSITQGLEEEIIASLEELLQALEQAQQKLEEQKQQQQPPPQQPQGGQQSQPLVDAIQELKMIKSLQLRVNKRTDRYAKMLKAEEDPVGQANTKDLLDALDKLSDRQQQVFEIVREIVLGRNK